MKAIEGRWWVFENKLKLALQSVIKPKIVEEMIVHNIEIVEDKGKDYVHNEIQIEQMLITEQVECLMVK